MLVSKRARGGAFFGPQGVEVDGASKNLERALSFSLPELVAREGELVEKCVEVEAEEDAPPDAKAEEDTPLDEAEEDAPPDAEAEEDAPPDAEAEEDTLLDDAEEGTGVRQISKVTGDCGTTAENSSLSESSGPFEVKGEVDVSG